MNMVLVLYNLPSIGIRLNALIASWNSFKASFSYRKLQGKQKNKEECKKNEDAAITDTYISNEF